MKLSSFLFSFCLLFVSFQGAFADENERLDWKIVLQVDGEVTDDSPEYLNDTMYDAADFAQQCVTSVKETGNATFKKMRLWYSISGETDQAFEQFTVKSNFFNSNHLVVGCIRLLRKLKDASFSISEDDGTPLGDNFMIGETRRASGGEFGYQRFFFRIYELPQTPDDSFNQRTVARRCSGAINSYSEDYLDALIEKSNSNNRDTSGNIIDKSDYKTKLKYDKPPVLQFAKKNKGSKNATHVISYHPANSNYLFQDAGLFRNRFKNLNHLCEALHDGYAR